MIKNKVDLQELELMIQLLQWIKPELKSVTYSELTKEIKKEFDVDVEENDVYLLYEPTIEEITLSNEIYYGSMFNINKNI